MNELLVGLSSDLLFYKGKDPVDIRGVHRPYFLVFPPNNVDSGTAREKLVEKWKRNRSEEVPLAQIESIGDVETYQSFWDFQLKRKVFKVFTKKSYVVPEVSDYVFFEEGLFTAEHDIRYQERALVDLAADGTAWLYDTGGCKRDVRVLIYDIETTKYGEGVTDVPVDIIGEACFDVCFESAVDLAGEEFAFDIVDCPGDWKDIDIRQCLARSVDEEIDNLYGFCRRVKQCDIVSGHNILGFDNLMVYRRVMWVLKHRIESLSKDQIECFRDFCDRFCKFDKSFHFGMGSEIAVMYPSSFDTYLAARKFYSFLDSFSLKSVAPFLGVVIPNRMVLTPAQIKLDDRTLRYNQQDVQEQLGVTLHLLQQALPLAFTTGMPFELLLSSGAVSMWDHMALIRGAFQRKIMPPICRVKSVAQTLTKYFKNCNSCEDIVRRAKKERAVLSKDFVRVVKYGCEMPSWVEYPYVIYDKDPQNDESLGYHMPGGMTIKPDRDADSHFVPWYYVVVADVGAMYPTILKAMNFGADTVRVANRDEEVDEWIWLKRLPQQFLDAHNVKWRPVGNGDSFADTGVMVGIKISDQQGVVNGAMTGIMSLIAKIKSELKETKQGLSGEELQRLRMMYQSMKGARNAGTHGILSAPGVSGRQFNLWGAAGITTKGQAILADTLEFLRNRDIRVVYGDTDGIYLGCSRSMGNVAGFPSALDMQVSQDSGKWLSRPDDALVAIEKCNQKWRQSLGYPEFELEAENHDCMLFVKHKNYLIFDRKENTVVMVTKGNNFKGSDKANIARIALEKIMLEVLREHPCWDDEDEVRKSVKECIVRKTEEVLETLDLSTVDLEDLTLIQSVQPAKRYKPNQDGSISTYGKRSLALEKLLQRSIRSREKFKFVVTKKPLPSIEKPSKSGVKPIDFMYPVELLKDKRELDLEWYKKMIENYIQGAFGLSGVQSTVQKGLDAWM